ncbi:Uncharacterised protein [uncultured archaeon]|nr:Uncharacterised protein [uncultured archaeon]
METELKIILDKLIEFGEDREELWYWLDIFPDLEKKEQIKIFNLFKEEQKKLSVV